MYFWQVFTSSSLQGPDYKFYIIAGVSVALLSMLRTLTCLPRARPCFVCAESRSLRQCDRRNGVQRSQQPLDLPFLVLHLHSHNIRWRHHPGVCMHMCTHARASPCISIVCSQYVMMDTVVLSGNSDLPDGGQLNGDELPGPADPLLAQTQLEWVRMRRGAVGAHVYNVGIVLAFLLAAAIHAGCINC